MAVYENNVVYDDNGTAVGFFTYGDSGSFVIFGQAGDKRLEKIVLEEARKWPVRLITADLEDAGYRVYMHGYDKDRKILAIKSLRDLTGMGLKDAKEAIEGPMPIWLCTFPTAEEARNFINTGETEALEISLDI